MSLGHGAKIVTDDLVFAYDMGSRQSFKGAPVTNVLLGTNLDTGWSKGYCKDILWDDYPPPYGVKSQVVSFLDADGNNNGYWYSYGDYAPQSPSTTYSVSVYARTVGSSFSIKPYTANNSEAGRQNLNTLTVPGDGEWHRLEFSAITTPSNTQSDSLSFNFPSIPANQRVWLCAPQMTATNYHAPFVNGTRSNTEAVLDWTGRNVITTNDLTYTSDNKFLWDASARQYLQSTGTDFTIGTTGFTMEFWVKHVSASSYLHIGTLGSQASGMCLKVYRDGIGNDGKIYMYAGGGTYNSDSYVPDWNLDLTGKHTHVVASRVGGTLYCYLNGVLKGSYTNQHNVSSNNFTIGDGVSTSEFASKEIPVAKLYNRGLSSEEVAQNFNALRGRFGV